MFRYKPEAVDYALNHPDGSHRMSSISGDSENRSRLERNTQVKELRSCLQGSVSLLTYFFPNLLSSRPGSHCSVQSAAEDEIEAVRDKLNITDIDQVVDRLR